jgi:DNA-binding CsgD family transcriptional regulator
MRLDMVTEHLDAIRNAPTPDLIRSRLLAFGAGFGIEHVMCGTIPGADTPPRQARGAILFNNWPINWLNRYVERRYVEIDPVIRKVLRAGGIFDWRDARARADDLHIARRMMGEAREHGLAAGFAVPFTGPRGERGSLSLGGDRIEIPPAAVGFLALAASFAAEQAISLTVMDEPRAPLTPRERDCLLWTAEGKTEWETAGILGIAPATVASHLAAARRKLDAANKAHLVAKAFRAGLIR